MFSTSASFLYPDNSGNDSGSGGNSEKGSGLVPRTHPDAIKKEEEYNNALSNRSGLGDEYGRLNDEHSALQDADCPDSDEERELTESLDCKGKELKNADNALAKCHEEYKNLTGLDLDGAEN